MMNVDQLKIRSFSPEADIPRLLSLLACAEASDQERMETSEETLRLQLNLPGHDPHHDRWVIDCPADLSSLAASALIRLAPGSDHADANILVHPDWRRRGLGSALLSRILDRAHQLEAGSVQIYASASLNAALSFLHKHAFQPLGAYTELRLAEDVRLPPVTWPYGYTVRSYEDVQDLSLLTQAMNLGYIPLWGHQQVSEEQMSSWLPEFNLAGIFLVFSEKGRVVGISRVEPSPERSRINNKPTGYIDAPGIVPQHRRLDLYRALVLTGIRWLRDQGQALIEMESWGDKLEVLNMYRELGFIDKRRLICYEKKLSGGENKSVASP